MGPKQYQVVCFFNGPRTIWHRGQFGTVDNLAPPMLADNLAPQCKSGQFGTRTIWHRSVKWTIWHRGQFGTAGQKWTIWHRGQFGTADNLAPWTIWHHSVKVGSRSWKQKKKKDENLGLRTTYSSLVQFCQTLSPITRKIEKD